MSAKNSAKGKRKKRSVVKQRQNGMCALCNHDCNGIRMHLIQIVDKRYGGTFTLDNLIAVCESCSGKKSRGLLTT